MKDGIKKNTLIRKIITGFLIFISAFLVYFLVMSVISPGRRLSELKNEFGIKPDQKNAPGEQVLSDSTYRILLKERAFLQARTMMAQTDSIYLTINLKDSTAKIEISGVTVHASKICWYSISNILENGDVNIISNMLSKPFTIESTKATIRKEPVMIKTAPKDTSEYKPDIVPDTSIVEPVNYMLEMTDGLRIYIFQEEKEKGSDRRSFFSFNFINRFRDGWTSLKSVLLFEVPEYHPFIKIRLPREDGKIIFRALPKNGQVAVYT